jgi:ATP-dependent Clp protease ATP-binding subunit ClpA
VQLRIDEGGVQQFTFNLSDRAKEFLLAEGIDNQYGARHLKRAIERLLVHPLANLSASGQVRLGDVVVVDYDRRAQELTFYRDEAMQAMAAAAAKERANASRKQSWFDFRQRGYPFAGAERSIG